MKRIAAMFIAAVLILSSVIACSSDTKPSGQNQQLQTMTGDDEATTTNILDYLGQADWNGAQFTIIGKNANYGEWEMFEINADEETGEPVNDAVFNRNLQILERYNLEFVGYKSADPINEFRNSIMADADDFSGALLPIDSAVGPAKDGLFYDFNSLPTVDLSHTWFDQNARSTLSVADKLFFCFGDMNLQNLDLTWCVMFNKQLAGDIQLGNIYDFVAQNKWTIDKLFELSTNATFDLNGDGNYNEQDQWGMITPYDRTAYALMYGAGVEFVNISEKGYPEFKPLDEKTFELFSKILSFYHNDNNVLNINKLTRAWRESEEMFMRNQGLFYVECMQNLARFRAMEVDFGVLPMPKYNEEQSEYRHMVCEFPAAFIIPANTRDVKLAGFATEVINAASHNTVRAAYVDKCLKYKYTRDDESTGMLEIILNTMYYDPLYIYGWGGFIDAVGMLVTKNYDILASQAKSLESKIVKDIEKTIEAYEKLEF